MLDRAAAARSLRAMKAADDASSASLGAAADALSGARIALLTLGSRGDHQPFLLLARALKAQGATVTFVANTDYRRLAAGYGVEVVPALAIPFAEAMAGEEIDRLFDQHAGRLSNLRHLPPLVRSLRAHFAGLMLRTAAAIRGHDLVVYNPGAFFAGEFARDLGIPSARVLCQPLLPSAREPLSLLGRQGLGRLGNRLSYEVARLPSLFPLAAIFRAVRRESGLGAGLRAGTNLLTVSQAHSRQILAYSAALAPPPGDAPVAAVQTGFWFDEDAPAGGLAPEVEAFLAAGPPPVCVGLGSMLVHARRNTQTVIEALAQWGGRAIVVRGPGLALPPELPPNVVVTGGVRHDDLFPRVAAVVGHGGAGTVAAASRHGLPQVILPVLGDQVFWGRLLAEAGVCELPIPVGRITSAELAARIARACDEPRHRAAARSLGARLARDPGLSGAIAALGGMLAEARR